MATAWEKIKANSVLSSGTAWEHLSNPMRDLLVFSKFSGKVDEKNEISAIVTEKDNLIGRVKVYES